MLSRICLDFPVILRCGPLCFTSRDPRHGTNTTRSPIVIARPIILHMMIREPAYSKASKLRQCILSASSSKLEPVADTSSPALWRANVLNTMPPLLRQKQHVASVQHYAICCFCNTAYRPLARRILRQGDSVRWPLIGGDIFTVGLKNKIQRRRVVMYTSHRWPNQLRYC